jgi:hypothetical protein
LSSRRAPPLFLLLALLIGAVLATTTVTQVGVVGEVAASWALESPPRVVVDWQGPLWADYDTGWLRASLVRPLERLQIGGLSLPLAVNSYTGGPPDWPARLVYALSGSTAMVTGLHVALGGLLMVLVHRFLRFHGTTGSGGIAALVLATDWSFVFYRKVLGGTELLLMAASLLVLWAFWSRRWAGGRLGSPAIAVGVGLGLLAKATFAVSLLAFGLAALLTRGDQPEGRKAPPPTPLWQMSVVVLVLTSPLWISALDHLGAPASFPSHDYLGLQLERLVQGLERLLSGERTPARETGDTLAWFLSNPLPWFEAAYGGEAPEGLSFLRLVGWGLGVGGSALEWLRPRKDRAGALLRFVSLYAPLQILLLWLANRDLHHLAQASPTVAIWFALAVNRLAQERLNIRSWGRAMLAFALTLPWMVAGSLQLWRTDAVLASLTAPTFTERGQAELIEGLRSQGVERLAACDYELYGMVEIRAPELEVTHAWANAAARLGDRGGALEDLLSHAQGGHYLWLRPSAPMIYNLSPSDKQLAAAADAAEVQLEETLTLEDREGPWARLYEVRAVDVPAPDE